MKKLKFACTHGSMHARKVTLVKKTLDFFHSRGYKKYLNQTSAQKNNLNSKPHVLASIWDILEVNWLSLKKFIAILVSPTWEISGGKKVNFFKFQVLKIIVKPDFNAKNKTTFKATLVTFNLKHFSGQLIKFKEFHNKFSDFNSKKLFFLLPESEKLWVEATKILQNSSNFINWPKKCFKLKLIHGVWM